MTVAKPKTQTRAWPWVRIGILTCLWFSLLLGLLLIAGRFFLTTEAGARFVEGQINSRSFGPIESISVTGLSGDLLGELSIDRLTIADETGVWLDISTLTLSLQPLALLSRHISVESVSAERIHASRRPALKSSEPSETDSNYRFTLNRFDLNDVVLDEPIIGQALTLDASGAFNAAASGALEGSLKIKRTDQSGDQIDLDFSQTDAGIISGQFAVTGSADGPIATLVRAPVGSPIFAKGVLTGTDRDGQGEISLSLSDKEAMTGQLLWTEQALDATLQADLEAWPDVSRFYMGSEKTLTSTLFVSRTAQNPEFSADFNLPGLSIQADGTLPDDGWRPETVTLDARVARLSDFIDLPEGYRVSDMSVNGQAALISPYGFNGTLLTGPVETTFGKADGISGPISVRRTGDDVIGFSSDLTVSRPSTDRELPIALNRRLRLTASGTANLDDRIVTLQAYRVVTGNNEIRGQGRYALDEESADVSGTTRLQILAEGARPGAELVSEFSIKLRPDHAIALNADGRLTLTTAIEGIAGSLIGDTLLFDIKSSFEETDLTLTEGRILSDRVRLAVTGSIGEKLDLIGEAVLAEGVMIGPFDFANGGTLSFTANGPQANPSVRLDASADIVGFQDYDIQFIRTRADISEIVTRPNGPITLNAETPYGPLDADLRITSDFQTINAETIRIDWNDITLQGNLSRQASGLFTGEIRTSLPGNDDRFARASLVLLAENDQQTIRATAEANAVEWDGWQFDRVQADLKGTMTELAGAIRLEGQKEVRQISRRFGLSTPLSLRHNATSENSSLDFELTLKPDFHIDGMEGFARGPTRLRSQADGLSLQVPLTLEGSDFNLNYATDDEQEQLSVKLDPINVSNLPLPPSIRDTRGQVSADMELSASIDGPPQGQLQITLSDWRGATIKAGRGISGRLETILEDQRAANRLRLSSSRGFSADGQITVSLLSASRLQELRPNMNAPLAGRFEASGSAAALLSLVAPDDADVGGILTAQAEIGGSLEKPGLTGQANLQNLTFEIPEFGTRIAQGRADILFTEQSVSVQDLSAKDANNGQLSGDGAFELGAFGRPLGTLSIRSDKFEVVNRRDFEATASGNLNYESRVDDAALSGNITVDTATAKEFIRGNTSVVSIDVEEINKPERLISSVDNRPKTDLNLDLTIQAPRRLFIRSRGLDLEMSATIKIQGTATDPKFYGQANIVRGGYRLAGRTLSINSGGMVFNGGLSDASINMRASTRTQNLDVSVTISGTVEQPEIQLSSSPERPQDEILSALLFGRSVTELSTLEAAQLAGSLAQLSGRGAGLDLLGGLREAFGISQLSVDVNPEGTARIVGGRYISEDVYLQVFSGGAQESGAIIDWTIRQNLSLRSRIEADNDHSLSLKWKRDF